VEAFLSGFLVIPIQDVGSEGNTFLGEWGRVSHFLILAAFLGGFAESLLNRMVGQFAPSTPAG
jgi:hypothetical protein